MAVRVLDGDGGGSTADIVAGIAYAAKHGADVINMSLGGPAGSGDAATSDAIEAAGEENVVVVVAAGNDGSDNDIEPESPCVLPEANLICVAALSQSGALASFSNYGAKSVDLAAPGTSILSAKTDYGAPLFSDAFDSGFPGPWTTTASDGGVPWGTSSSAVSAPLSATDSPGGDYGHAPNFSKTAKSDLFTTAPVDLSGERGCRLHFNTKYEIESTFDVFLAGAASESLPFDGQELDGASPGYPSSFTREEASVSELDGQVDVHPFFAVFSDEEVEFDGAYVDDVRLFCRDETYVDGIATSGNYDQPESGNYVRFQGTSMATPHVAGVVALVRAAAPGLDAQEVVQAVLDGASAIPTITPGKRTATEGIADACKAIALATGGEVEAQCPASSEPTPQPPPKGGTEPPPIPVAPVIEIPTSFSPPSIPRAPRSSEPRTFFTARPAKVIRTRRGTAKAAFEFGSNERGVTFLCRVDRGRFRKCQARFVRRYEVGGHVLRVKARDAAGNTDRTPAVYRFQVKRVGA
jgi:subtilisin family serine protease